MNVTAVLSLHFICDLLYRIYKSLSDVREEMNWMTASSGIGPVLCLSSVRTGSETRRQEQVVPHKYVLMEAIIAKAAVDPAGLLHAHKTCWQTSS